MQLITRRAALCAGGVGLLVASRAGRGQGVAAIRRIGWLSIGSKDSPTDLHVAFKEGMRDLGWREGETVEYQFLYADGSVDRLDAMAAELVRRAVDIIVVNNALTTRAAQKATKTIPVLMTGVSNPVSNGFVASLAKPGGNVTGLVIVPEEVQGKLIGILHEIVPKARRIAVMVNDRNLNHAAFWSAARDTCSALDLEALRFAASAPAQFHAVVDQIIAARAQAVLVVADPVFLNERVKLQALMQATRLPVAYSLRQHVLEGGLLSYSSDLAALYRYAAKYAHRILQGTRPADLPLEQPTKFELVINLKTAKALGLTAAPSLLLRADEVIE
jgi:putative ABC transport system substrate-binding protein